MIPLTPIAERLQTAFKPTPRGVVGLVDDLLELCREHKLRLNFEDGRCHVRSLEANSQDALDVPLPQSVFRAVLARIAALCNERVPNSVTPYRGEGTLSVGINPSTAFHVSFTNTPTEQRLEVRSVGEPNGEADGKLAANQIALRHRESSGSGIP